MRGASRSGRNWQARLVFVGGVERRLNGCIYLADDLHHVSRSRSSLGPWDQKKAQRPGDDWNPRNVKCDVVTAVIIIQETCESINVLL